MKNLKKSWASALNAVFTSGVDQAVQYREAFFGFKQQAVANGGVLQLSCDGVVADANDNLQAATDVAFGTDGVEVLSYFVIRMATGWVDGGDVYLLVVANNAAADATPQSMDVYASTSPFALVANPTQNRPTAVGEVSWLAQPLIPHAAAAPARFHATRTTVGDLVFGVSTDGTGVMDFGALFARSPKTAPYDLEGNYRCVMYMASPGGGVGAFHRTPLLDPNNWRTFDALGAPVAGGNVLTGSIAFLALLFTNGLSGSSGRLWNAPIGLVDNRAAGRWLGPLEDIRAIPSGAVVPDTEDGDGATTRYVAIDNLIVPVTSAQLPIVL